MGKLSWCLSSHSLNQLSLTESKQRWNPHWRAHSQSITWKLLMQKVKITAEKARGVQSCQSVQWAKEEVDFSTWEWHECPLHSRPSPPLLTSLCCSSTEPSSALSPPRLEERLWLCKKVKASGLHHAMSPSCLLISWMLIRRNRKAENKMIPRRQKSPDNTSFWQVALSANMRSSWRQGQQ